MKFANCIYAIPEEHVTAGDDGFKTIRIRPDAPRRKRMEHNQDVPELSMAFVSTVMGIVE